MLLSGISFDKLQQTVYGLRVGDMLQHGGLSFVYGDRAGTFAGRIVTYGKVGDSVKKASQCGLIKFGSRIDMYLPLDADIRVEVGDKVRACESVIATLGNQLR